MKHAWLVALLACVWSSMFAVGCGDVESCREAETPGCINTAPRLDQTCLFDLVLRNGRCVKPGSAEDKCGLCAPGALCVPEQNQCVDFCAAPVALPGSVPNPPAILCEAVKQPGATGSNPMLTFAEACTRRCNLRCQRLAQFCPGYQCPMGSCDLPEVQAKCALDCPPPLAGGQDVACLTKSCNDARFTRCDSTISCPNGVAPACANITCTNDCSFKYQGQAVVGDGVCDDGDVLSSASPYCDWGTDCVDCGPRMGTTPPAPAPLGGLCEWTENCAGATGLPSSAAAWCVGLMSTGAKRCMPDCSRGQACAEGFECHLLEFDDPMDATMSNPVTEGKLTSSACVPTKCK